MFSRLRDISSDLAIVARLDVRIRWEPPVLNTSLSCLFSGIELTFQSPANLPIANRRSVAARLRPASSSKALVLPFIDLKFLGVAHEGAVEGPHVSKRAPPGTATRK